MSSTAAQTPRWFGVCMYDRNDKKLPAYRVWDVSEQAATAKLLGAHPGADLMLAMDLTDTTFGQTLAPGTAIGEVENDGFWSVPYLEAR